MNEIVSVVDGANHADPPSLTAEFYDEERWSVLQSSNEMNDAEMGHSVAA